MKIFEEVEVTRKQKRVVSRVCDLCKAKAHTEEQWTAGVWTVDETELRVSTYQKDGKQYPEGGSGTICEIDLCPTCFKEKLIPWLKSQGANVEEKEWNS